MRSNVLYSSLVGVFLIGAIFGSAFLGSNLTSLVINDGSDFSISADSQSGINFYNLVEIDEGDNDEDKVVTYIYHNFTFTSLGSESVNWDFGDGGMATGQMVSHQYEIPGVYLITATSLSTKGIEVATTMVTVHLSAEAKVDNMECECAPTAKDTVIDLIPTIGSVKISGYLLVEHDGSSESCSLRNPLQECHLRVIIQRTQSGNIISEDVIFDNTFRNNEQVVDFQIEAVDIYQGEGVQIRLETDQLRDWHKPSAIWDITILDD
jgi:PKD repeat protein